MSELWITPNPNNFTVWYHYHAGTFPDLQRALDVLLENKQKFSAARCAEIFERFFPSDADRSAINDTTNRIEAELETLLEFLGIAGIGAADYGKTLEGISGQLANPGGIKDLKSVIGNTLSATRAMQERNTVLEEKLNVSSGEVSRLKEDLEHMRREATTDALTGIANRKLFDSELRRAAMMAMEEGETLCLLIIDIDHFKKFNDTYGHQIGDQVLKLLADTLTETIKGQDLAARYGGEEFSVILPNTTIENATKVAEDIRHRISTRRVRNRRTGESLGQICVSIGIGLFEFGEPLGHLITRADHAMYVAKRTGRNRVVTENDVEGWADSDEESKLMFDS
jgi:diguanylate cyclase